MSIPSKVGSSPAIGVDGTIYFASQDGKLHAVSPDGSLVWSMLAGGSGTPTVGPDGTIYVSGNGINAISPDGSLKWTFTTGQPTTASQALARIHRWTGMDGVRAAEGGEGVTGAMIRGLEFG